MIQARFPARARFSSRLDSPRRAAIDDYFREGLALVVHAPRARSRVAIAAIADARRGGAARLLPFEKVGCVRD